MDRDPLNAHTHLARALRRFMATTGHTSLSVSTWLRDEAGIDLTDRQIRNYANGTTPPPLWLLVALRGMAPSRPELAVGWVERAAEPWLHAEPASDHRTVVQNLHRALAELHDVAREGLVALTPDRDGHVDVDQVEAARLRREIQDAIDEFETLNRQLDEMLDPGPPQVVTDRH